MRQHLGVTGGALPAVTGAAGGEQRGEGGDVVAADGLGAGGRPGRKVAREALVHAVHGHAPCQQLAPAHAHSHWLQHVSLDNDFLVSAPRASGWLAHHKRRVTY